MFSYDLAFRNFLSTIKSECRYREFSEISASPNAAFPIFCSGNKFIVSWCTNNYLGMASNPFVIDEAINTIRMSGVGSGGTRNISGNHTQILQLEATVASLHRKDSALVLSSGYVANYSTLKSLASILPGCVFFSDECNHASIIEGIVTSKCSKYVFAHNNMKDLERCLSLVDINVPKIIVFESIYSMDGTVAPIEKLCSLAEKYNAITFIDEMHAVGMYGDRGAGIAESFSDKISIIQGSFAKSFGAVGGYIASSVDIIDSIRSVASGFIFTTSIPPSIAAAARKSVELLMFDGADIRAKHMNVVRKTKNVLRPFISDDVYTRNTHIIPVKVNNPTLCKKISKTLLDDFGIFIQCINFPTVPRGEELLRITPTPYHTDKMIEDLKRAMECVMSICYV